MRARSLERIRDEAPAAAAAFCSPMSSEIAGLARALRVIHFSYSGNHVLRRPPGMAENANFVLAQKAILCILHARCVRWHDIERVVSERVCV
jgi:hypothetical protein